MSAKVKNSHINISKELLIENYISDTRPWIIGYSGGKDSTLLLQLVFEILSDDRVNNEKPIHIITSDTGVEPPNILTHVKENLANIQTFIDKQNLPINIHQVVPSLDNKFWVNLIGRGYPSPTRWFRWCTSKMKIKPTKGIIEQLVEQHGSTILLLGTRKDESQARKRSIEKREYSTRRLNPHHEIKNTLVLAPISDWTTDEVWEYLFNELPPWGGNHDVLFDLYKQANSGECPLVVDLNTPSCGGSRFGCWTCTVVKTDKSMESFIEQGAVWMQPLNNFRNWIKEIREDEHRRNHYRRTGELGNGPFNSTTRQEILENLLDTESKLPDNIELISDDEIVHIQKIWTEEFDVMNSALKIANKFKRQPMKRRKK
ncbi:putative sulfurtransferase DndC [Desulfocapsa sulfexigens DSM 10523]|uniref:Putative sulfurtransferase DndC n=1 Tax=Desulfocapsa sulfexigens (strain DSM 10523 / SB164P1) TaxID=1167006 RepID=M1P122_DESSD|nr:DNA phosphorothioation system sulfurtransferase DndC [Desulfocapsa sulfexigens]AGF77228.1 putative sulfurtransferase DndC [Desulfocapsa sulfexigens DSM 10523]